MNLNKISQVLSAHPAYRYRQINKYVYQDYISDWSEASSLPKSLRDELTQKCSLDIKSEIIESANKNNVSKALLFLSDGEAIETVLIKQKGRHHDDDGDKISGNRYRYTACLSSQIGCALDCKFCATGQAGFKRNLSAEEIIEQAVFWERYLKAKNPLDKIDNIVFMGMGEPFLNYLEFIKAVKFLNNPETMNIGARRLSVSTVGITEGIKRLAGEKIQINLAISLHAPDDNLRQKLMPVAKKYLIADLLKSVDDYIKKTNRRVMFEYLMIKGVNDSMADAVALGRLLGGRPLCLLNLIPYNETASFQSSSKETIESFRRELEKMQIAATVRLSFGADIKAACGQLSSSRKKNNT